MAEVEVAAPVSEANGHDSVLANGDVPAVAEADTNIADAEVEQPEPVSKGLYILRMPRPTFDEAPLKKLEAELSAVFTKLKAINNKSQTKRGEANELRKQLAVARSLRNGSSPEFDEKMTRLKQLREMRKSILDKVAEMKSGRAGLECRTEEELDEKIAEMEHSIQHDGLTLNVEKQYVRNIAKLKSQREKIREVQNQQENLVQMEAEAKKIKAVIDEVDSEMNILRGERDQAKDIIDDLQKKLGAVTAVLTDYDLERQDLETTKREIQDQIKTLREEIDNHMFEWRANRKLSLQLRDLVAEGKVEEAQAIAEQQVESYLTKLLTDTAFRREYFKLWAEQRRYLVSELLPESGAVEAKPAAAAAKGAKGTAAKRDVPLVPQGAAKAQAIIAAALADADAVVAAKKLAEPQPVLQEEPSTEEVDDAEAEAAPIQQAARIVPGATDDLVAGSGKAPRAHKTGFDYAKAMSEMPEVPDYEYIMPPPKQQTSEQLSAAEMKARVREEQRQKAAEAEARKKKRQEQLAKKAAAAKQKAAEQQASAAASAAATTLTHRAAAAAAAAEEVVEGASGTDGEGEAAEQPVVQQQKQQKGAGNKHLPAKAKQQLAAAAGKKPVIKKPAKVLKWHQQYSQELVVVIFVLVMLLLVLLWYTTK